MVEDSTLKSYLARLAINVEAFAFSTAPLNEQEAKAPPPRELIYSQTIKDSNEPTIICHEEEGNPHIYVVWRIEIFICERCGPLAPPPSDVTQVDHEANFTNPPCTFSPQQT